MFLQVFIRLKYRDVVKCALLTLMLSCSLSAGHELFAQTNEKKKEVPATTISADTTEAERLWVVGTTWGNNSSFLGRNQAERLPFISTDLSYISKKGFWLSGIAYQVVNTPAFIDEVDLTAGWSFYLSKHVDASVSYSKYFFSSESALLKASTGNALNGAMGLDWTYIYSRLTSTVTFGGSTDFFLILDNSRYFGKGKLFHKADSLTFEPRFSIIAGTQTFVKSHMATRPAPEYSPVSGFGKPGGVPGSGGGTSEESTVNTSSFAVLNYELALPITYSINHLSLELTPRYSIPVNQLEGSATPSQLFVTASLYYVFRSKK